MQRNLLTVGLRAAQGSILANLKGLTDEESLRILGIEGNSVNWIAGHLLASRDRAQERLAGQAFLSPDEAKLYRTGTSPRPEGRTCVPLGRLQDGLRSSGESLLTRWGALSEADLDKEVDPKSFRFPVEKPTLGALLSFFVFHEGYHSGQLGLARRILGKPSGLGF